jgi:DNA-binding NarL/FixJ family response regulator
VLYSFESALPLVWDSVGERGKNPKTDAFLVDAVAHGVGSGVAFRLRRLSARTLVSLSHGARRSIAAREAADRGQSRGHLALRTMLPRNLRERRHRERALRRTSKERRSVRASGSASRLAAHGMTGADIAFKLGITERGVTVSLRQHREQAGVLNRQEAIAKGIAQGIIRMHV